MTDEEIKYCKNCKENKCGNILCRAKANYIKTLEESIEDWKADHKHNLELMQGLNERIAELKKENEELRKNQIVWHNSDELPPVYENSLYSINVLTEDGVYVEYDFDAHHWIVAGTNRKIIIKKWTDSFPSSCK